MEEIKLYYKNNRWKCKSITAATRRHRRGKKIRRKKVEKEGRERDDKIFIDRAWPDTPDSFPEISFPSPHHTTYTFL